MDVFGLRILSLRAQVTTPKVWNRREAGRGNPFQPTGILSGNPEGW